MVVILERDKTERLQDAVRGLSRRAEDFGHAVHRARFGLKGNFYKVALRELMRQPQQPTRGRNGLEFCSGAAAVFHPNRSQDRVAQLDPGRAPRRVRLGEMGHKTTSLWPYPRWSNRLPKPIVRIPLWAQHLKPCKSLRSAHIQRRYFSDNVPWDRAAAHRIATIFAFRPSGSYHIARRISMRCILSLVFLSSLFVVTSSQMLEPAHPEPAPLRVGLVGLVHGHVHGFLQQSLHSPEIEIVGIAEPDQQLAAQYAARYGFDRGLLFSDLEEMLQKVHPQAVLVYTNTYDHRRVEICARHGAHVMMEKPLAVSLDDALAMEKAAHSGKIQVLVNYETSWYPSNWAAYDLAHQKAIGDIRKVVVHDGHPGPKEIGVGPEFLAWLTDPKLDGGGALFDFGC